MSHNYNDNGTVYEIGGGKVNMNGTVSRVKSAKDIQPGCEIVVPAKSKNRGMSLTEILSLGSITATLAAVVATLVK